MTPLKSNPDSDFLPSFVSDFFSNDRFFAPGNWFGKLSENSFPAVNIRENEAGFDIDMAVPGFKKEDFKLHLEGKVLTIGAEKKLENEDKTDKFTRREYNYQSFTRAFSLPESCDPESIDAVYENGILNIRIAKRYLKEGSERRHINIK